MLARDLEIADVDGRHWGNWLRLLLPPGVLDEPRFALVWLDKGELLKAVVRGRGAVNLASLGFEGTEPAQLRTLAEQLGVDAVVVFGRDVLAEVFTTIDSDLRADDDYAAQGLAMLRALKKYAGKGIWSEPRLLDLLPTPPFESLQKTFDLLVGDDTSLMAYIFEDDGSNVHASVIATKVNGHIDQVATHFAIADAISGAKVARAWRADPKRAVQAVTAAVSERFSKPAVGVFMSRASFYRILTGPTDTLTREIRARKVVIDPAPAWLLGLLGGATVAAVATRSARAFARFLPPQARQLASDLAREAKGAAQAAGASPFALLGFDPVELWLSLRQFYGAPRG